MNAMLGDGAKVTFGLLILRNQQNVPAQRVRDAKFERHIRVQAREIDDDVSGNGNEKKAAPACTEPTCHLGPCTRMVPLEGLTRDRPSWQAA